MIHTNLTFEANTSDIFNKMTDVIQTVSDNGITVSSDDKTNQVEIEFNDATHDKMFVTHSLVKDLLHENGMDVIYTEQSSRKNIVGTLEQKDSYWERQLGSPKRPAV